MKKLVLAAAAVLSFSASASAVDIPLTNGSFDTGVPGSNTFGLIANWNAQSVPAGSNFVGVFTSYAGFTPVDGPRMALLNNMGTSIVSLRQLVPIELLQMPYFHFQYMYLTTDPTTTTLANRDRFSVVIDYFTDAAGLNQVGTETYLIDTGSLVSTGVNPGAPFSANVNRMFDTVPSLINGILPISIITAPYANFTFYLENNGTTAGGVSGVLLDNVYINPEPGTMALFGLGAAGLGAMAWRRRKAKLALQTK